MLPHMARRREKRAKLDPTILPGNLQFSVGVPIGHEDVKFRAHGGTSGFVFVNQQSSPVAYRVSRNRSGSLFG
jgi:hypothetical protein